jgi:hypothetical protein
MHNMPDSENESSVATGSSENRSLMHSDPHAKVPNQSESTFQVQGVFLALLPVASFLAQYWFSQRAGTQQFFFRHLTVMVLDWFFVPFNYFVVRVIDWRRGGTIYLIACLSFALNALTHAFWQYNGLDLGHMITRGGVVLPAGWVHLTFSSLEMVLLVGFVFCRKSKAQSITITTSFAVLYFVTMGICGYVMHQGFIISDVVVCFSGVFFVLVYPRLRQF